jgi:hypothetical protein
MNQLLPRIGRLNILMCNRRPADNMARHFWFEMYLLSQVLRDRLPRMKILQITAYAPPPSPNKEACEQLVRNELRPRVLGLPPSDLVNGFSLLRHTEGCCQGCDDETLSSMANEDFVSHRSCEAESKLSKPDAHGRVAVCELKHRDVICVEIAGRD